MTTVAMGWHKTRDTCSFIAKFSFNLLFPFIYFVVTFNLVGEAYVISTNVLLIYCSHNTRRYNVYIYIIDIDKSHACHRLGIKILMICVQNIYMQDLSKVHHLNNV